jgi:hypothetical protein
MTEFDKWMEQCKEANQAGDLITSNLSRKKNYPKALRMLEVAWKGLNMGKLNSFQCSWIQTQINQIAKEQDG